VHAIGLQAELEVVKPPNGAGVSGRYADRQELLGRAFADANRAGSGLESELRSM